MTFINTRLPTKVEINAVRRDVEEIEIVTTDGGWEVRNARRAQSLLDYDISFPTGRYDNATIQAVIALYKQARGSLHTFLFRDFAGNSETEMVFGTGDAAETVFQLMSYGRYVTRPISPVQIYVDGVLTTALTVNYSNGEVTFDSAPAEDAELSWTGFFDVVVRFDTPLTMTALTGSLAHIDTLTLKEVLE